MKGLLYPRLAAIGIRKNLRVYAPYFFACSGMIMIFYITDFLANSDFVASQPGGNILSIILRIGWVILTAFSAVFLFYTNSFLIKRRKTEFGLYNILGMGKRNIMLILVYEIGFIFIGSLLLGTALGIAFSKLFEIGLVAMLGGKNTYDFSINQRVIIEEFCVFLALFGIILVSGMRQIRINDAIKLFRSENYGERPPRANWFLAVLGMLLLIAGYVLANIVKDPFMAILAFFAAVILVIAATYLLFISGSVVVCKLLRKNKKFYYKTNHFVSTAQMAFRMKRNGAGLASICILATMALVTISSTSGLFFGSEQVMRRMYPRDVIFAHINSDDQKYVDFSRDAMIEIAREKGIEPKNIVQYHYINNNPNHGLDNPCIFRGKKLITDEEWAAMTPDETDETMKSTPSTRFYLIPISDYNSVMGTDLSVNPGEALVLRLKNEPENETYDYIPIPGESHDEYSYDTNGEITEIIKRYETLYLKGAGTVDDFVVIDGRDIDPLSNTDIFGNIFMTDRYAFINDEDFALLYERRLADREEFLPAQGGLHISKVMYHYVGMDFDCSDDEMAEIRDATMDKMDEYLDETPYVANGKVYNRSDTNLITGVYSARSEFYALYGGLFFLGVLFCIVFVLAAVLIMYYKQISEGYEDKARFEILQKVGMTKGEIRSSINWSVLTLFFLPLLAAGVHTVFAFGLISKLLMLFGPMDTWFLALVALGCFLLYAVVYVVAYRLTSKIYYKIVAA